VHVRVRVRARARARVCVCVRPPHACMEDNFALPAAAPPAQPSSAPPHTGSKNQHSSSIYIGVFRVKASSSWECKLWDPQTKRLRYIGSFASEEDAARAYDRAAVQQLGSDAKRNFPDEDISELPVSSGGGRKLQGSSSRYRGVTWHKGNSSWCSCGTH
jgi:hypothetical protein